MQKILLSLLLSLLIGVYFFINTKEDTKRNIKISHPTKEEKYHPKESIKESIKFKSDTNTPHASFSSKIKPDITKDLESKTETQMEKEILQDLQSRITNEMQNIPTCLEDAKNKNDALNCNRKLQALHEEFELILGLESNNDVEINKENFIWNEITKENLIKELDNSMQPMQEMYNCILVADTEEGENNCFK